MKKGILLGLLAGVLLPCFCFGWSNGAKVIGGVTNGNLATYNEDANIVDSGVSVASVTAAQSDITALGGNASNSYVVVSGLTEVGADGVYTFDSIVNSRPKYVKGTYYISFSDTVYEPLTTWEIHESEEAVYQGDSTLSQSYYPPTTIGSGTVELFLVI